MEKNGGLSCAGLISASSAATISDLSDSAHEVAIHGISELAEYKYYALPVCRIFAAPLSHNECHGLGLNLV